MIKIVDGQFFCPTCNAQLTIKSEDGGNGFSARCKTCKKTHYYPSCERCDQALWKHDDDDCKAIFAQKNGRRYCRTCKKIKNPNDFNMNATVRSSRCKKCQSDYFKDWYYSKNRTATKSESVSDDILDELFGRS